MDESHHRRLEGMYLAAPVNHPYDPSIHVGRGKAEISFEVKPAFFHAGGTLHGASLFKALDDAAYFAASSLVADVFIVTASFHVHFLRPVRAGTLRAEGRVVSRTRQMVVAEAVLRDERNREVARGSGTFARTDLALADVAAYTDASAAGKSPSTDR